MKSSGVKLGVSGITESIRYEICVWNRVPNPACHLTKHASKVSPAGCPLQSAFQLRNLRSRRVLLKVLTTVLRTVMTRGKGLIAMRSDDAIGNVANLRANLSTVSTKIVLGFGLSGVSLKLRGIPPMLPRWAIKKKVLGGETSRASSFDARADAVSVMPRAATRTDVLRAGCNEPKGGRPAGIAVWALRP